MLLRSYTALLRSNTALLVAAVHLRAIVGLIGAAGHGR
jgi:ABC-type methionine transport system permease subunit